MLRDAALSILPYGHLVSAFLELGAVPHLHLSGLRCNEGLNDFLRGFKRKMNGLYFIGGRNGGKVHDESFDVVFLLINR